MSQVNGDGVLERVSEFFSCVRIADLVGHTLSPVPLHAGIVGVFGWDTIREIERLPLRRNKAPEHPDASLVVAGDVVAFDHWRQSVTLVTNVVVDGTDVDALFEGALASLQTMVNDLSTSAPEELRPARSRGDLPSAPFTRTVSSEAFQLMVREAKEQIAAGEIFQIVLSSASTLVELPIPLPCTGCCDTSTLGVSVLPAARRGHRRRLVPEALVQVRDGRVTTRPIAGSRPRGENEVENQLRAASLKEDPKEIAEHIMLVDLGRNDVGRVSRYGSVRVDELMTVETYSHIMHLTSQVSGELRDGVSAVDVLKATFPAGTLSGAPRCALWSSSPKWSRKVGASTAAPWVTSTLAGISMPPS
jgi:anthranilate synthase component 1